LTDCVESINQEHANLQLIGIIYILRLSLPKVRC